MSRMFSLSTIILLMACRSDKGVTAFNAKPDASITSHSDGDVVREGELISFRGSASDANHTPQQLTATWYVGSEVLCESTTPESDGTVQCDGILLPSDTEVTLEVKDAGNATTSASVNLTVTPTDAPEAIITAPESNGIFYSDQLIAFEGILSDSEDSAEDLIGYWTSSLDGELSEVTVEPNSEGEVTGYGLLSEGQHAIELHVEDSTGKAGLDSIIIEVGPPNSAPLCEILTPVTGSAGPEGELVTFTATASDVDVPADSLNVSWSSDKDGALGSSTPNSSGGVSFPYDSLSVNTHVISMVVSDEIGATCTADVIYTVGTPPSLTVISPIQNEIYTEGSPITFEATVSDNEDQPTNIGLSWDVDGTIISTTGPDSTGTAIFDDSSLSPGSHTLTATATDSAGLYATDVVTFSVNGTPSAPTVEITPDPAHTTSPLTANLTVPSTDPEGASIGYTYVWLKDNVIQSSQTTQSIAASDTTKGEQWTVRVTPNDGMVDGPFGEASITVQNTAPSVTSILFTPAYGSYNDIVYSCSPMVSDPDETPTVSYEWLLNGAPYGGNSSTLDLNGSGAMPDDSLSCTVTATDSDGATDSMNSGEIIITNRWPTLSNLVITPNSNITSSTSLTCSADVTDDDGEVVAASFEWTVGSNTYAGASLDLSTLSVIPGDQITCAANATDAYGGYDNDTISVTVINTLPTITASITANGSTNTGELTCSATAEDADDFPASPSVSYEWFDASNQSLGSSNPLQLDPSMGVDGDVISCVATATDASGGTASDNAGHTITNTPPVATSVLLTPTSPTSQTSSFNCSASGTDSDGDSVTFTTAWFLDGQPLSETSDQLSGSFNVGSLIVCQATPSDGKTNGQALEDSVTIANTPPVIDSVLLSPSTVYTSNTITATATATDVDNGQTLSTFYEWHVIDFDTGIDSVPSSGYNIDTFNGFSRDDEVYVIVTVNDNIDQSSPVTSSSITISNTAPSAPDISLSPNPAIEGQDDLICAVNVESTDEDGDAVLYTYEWTDPNGASAQTTAEVLDLSDTFAASGTMIGDWTCTVTAFDGTDIGGTDSATVTVESGCPVEGDGSAEDCPSIDCAMILADGHSTGDGTYWIDPQTNGSAYEVYCLMDSAYDGGGWTLISTHSDDGQDTWTWDNKAYFDTDTTTFGSLSNINEDYKSMALHEVGMQDLLFVHAPSGIWAGYNGVDTGLGDFASLVANIGGPNCYDNGQGFELSSGTLTAVENLCSTELFINLQDRDGGSCGTSNQTHSYGPAWSAHQNSGCFDDPGAVSGLGPMLTSPTTENEPGAYPSFSNQPRGYGYGWAILGNTGTAGLAENYMQVFVRRDYTDQDEDGVAAFEDCDDTNPTITYDCPCDSSGIGTYADFEIGASCPVAYWDMETTTGSGEIADLIGTVDLAINGSPTPGVSGVQGSTYAINACSDFFLSSSGYPSVLQGDTPKSISAWGHLGAKGGDGDGQAPLVSFGGGCGGTAFAVTYSTESLSGDAPMLGTCGNDLRPSATPWSLSQWYHIVGTYDGTELKLYVDGALVGTKSTTISTNTGHNHVGIGVDTWWNGTYHWLCNGKVDEVKLYSYELSSTEVSELYNLDADGDGVAAFEDCDDTDNMVSDTASGYSALCAAASCKTILAAGHSRGDDTYWLDPDGLGAFEVYCDMTTDGGGWTHIQSINSVNATQYDSTNILENRSTFGGLNDDNALSHAFYRVEFSESYLIDDANTTPVFSDTPFTNGTVNALLDSMQGSNYSSTRLWSIGSRTFLNVRNSSTSDGIFYNGDLRIDILLNEQDTTNIAHPVTSNYNANQNGSLESALVLDSDFGYAGGRIYGDPLYNISSVGVDNRMQLFVR